MKIISQRNANERLTIPIRVDGQLYRRVARLAQEQRRTVRAQFEVLVEQSMGAAQIERREARRG